ncbi:hypothetical protein Ancab_012547 [Ancistrocladus abbreviatus]
MEISGNNENEAYLPIKETFYDLNRRFPNSGGLSVSEEGNGASVLRIVPYAALHYMSYEQYRCWLLNNCSVLGTGSIVDLLAGSVAGGTAVLCTYPLDWVRTKLAYQELLAHQPVLATASLFFIFLLELLVAEAYHCVGGQFLYLFCIAEIQFIITPLVGKAKTISLATIAGTFHIGAALLHLPASFCHGQTIWSLLVMQKYFLICQKVIVAVDFCQFAIHAFLGGGQEANPKEQKKLCALNTFI